MSEHAPYRDGTWEPQSVVFWYLFSFDEEVRHEQIKRDGCVYTYPRQHQYHQLGDSLDRLFNLHLQRDILDMRYGD